MRAHRSSNKNQLHSVWMDRGPKPKIKCTRHEHTYDYTIETGKEKGNKKANTDQQNTTKYKKDWATLPKLNNGMYKMMNIIIHYINRSNQRIYRTRGDNKTIQLIGHIMPWYLTNTSSMMWLEITVQYSGCIQRHCCSLCILCDCSYNKATYRRRKICFSNDQNVKHIFYVV